MDLKTKKKIIYSLICIYILNSFISLNIFQYQIIYGVTQFVFSLIIISFLFFIKINRKLMVIFFVLLILYYLVLSISQGYWLIWLLQIILSFSIIFIISKTIDSYKIAKVPVLVHGGSLILHLFATFGYYSTHRDIMTFYQSLFYTYYYEFILMYLFCELPILILSIFVPAWVILKEK